MADQFKWTAIFLIKGAADNTAELSQMLRQLAAVNKSDDVAIVIGINIRLESVPALLPVPVVPGAGDPPVQRSGWTTLFYSLENKQGGGCLFTLITEKTDFKLREEKDITDFLRNQVLASFRADRYILFTWDHGQPFGIFPGINQTVVHGAMSTIAEEIQPEVFHFRLTRQRKKEKQLRASGIGLVVAQEEEEELPILTITELKDAIQWAFGEEKIDILVMSNCYLQFFDTGYELSACVDYLIAFETEMYFRDAFDYKLILETISNDAELSPENLSKAIVASYAMQRNNENLASKNAVALFANDLSWYPVIAKMIDMLADALIREMPRYREQIQKAVDKCEYISPNIPSFCLIDFRNFIRSLHNELPSLFNTISFEFFETVLCHLVTASYIGNDFIAEKHLSFVSPSCFSIYLPKKQGDYQTSFLDNFMNEISPSSTAFVRRFRWESFVTTLRRP